MAKKTYRVSSNSKWMGASGNALVAITNKVGSGKKIVIQSVEITNNTVFGSSHAADTIPSTPTRLKLIPSTSCLGGESLSLYKMDSAAANFPSTIQVKRDTSYSPTLNQWGVASYTDSTVAAGDTVFTPGSAPGWVTNQLAYSNKKLYVISGPNAGYWDIAANTTTDLTLLGGGFRDAGATTAIIVEIKEITHKSVLKIAAPANYWTPTGNFGMLSGKWATSGSVFHAGHNSNNQGIVIRAGEKVSLIADFMVSSLPLFVDATFILDGTPSRTYRTQFYTQIGGNHAIMSIDNNTGSGEVLRLVELNVAEVGTQDTPYFQLVPVSAIDPATFMDTDKKITAVPNDSLNGSLSSSICEIFTNAPVLPYGVPSSYIAEGAAAAATPRGFNYLNSKDFIGPVFMTFFAEAAAYKTASTTWWSTSVPGTMGTHLSQKYSTIKCDYAPIVIREGESLAIVSGAETATGSVAVGLSGWGSYDFAMTFYVDDTITPTIELTGLIVGTEVRAYVGTNPATATEIPGSGVESTAGTTHSFTHDVATQNGYVMIYHVDYNPIKIDFSPYQAAVVSYPIQQIKDRQYNRGTIYTPG